MRLPFKRLPIAPFRVSESAAVLLIGASSLPVMASVEQAQRVLNYNWWAGVAATTVTILLGIATMRYVRWESARNLVLMAMGAGCVAGIVNVGLCFLVASIFVPAPASNVLLAMLVGAPAGAFIGAAFGLAIGILLVCERRCLRGQNHHAPDLMLVNVGLFVLAFVGLAPITYHHDSYRLLGVETFAMVVATLGVLVGAGRIALRQLFLFRVGRRRVPGWQLVACTSNTAAPYGIRIRRPCRELAYVQEHGDGPFRRVDTKRVVALV